MINSKLQQASDELDLQDSQGSKSPKSSSPQNSSPGDKPNLKDKKSFIHFKESALRDDDPGQLGDSIKKQTETIEFTTDKIIDNLKKSATQINEQVSSKSSSKVSHSPTNQPKILNKLKSQKSQ